jgi:hypothetical protein
MPNGGPDCCGTCWFNSKNKDRAGYHRGDPDRDSEPDFCTIRDLRIENPLYTYCDNHPYRRPERDRVPIGPVFTWNNGPYREPWHPSPDTQQIRQHLLDLLDEISPEPPSKGMQTFPNATPADGGGLPEEVVVWQLGEFREPRAIDGLRRVASFDKNKRERLVQQAKNALTKIAVD